MGWENDYLIQNDPPDDREINSTGEEWKPWQEDDVVGYCHETYRLGNGRQVLFRHLNPEIQEMLSKALAQPPVPSGDMTPEEALVEAGRRWPEYAWCVHVECVSYNAKKFRCSVGYLKNEHEHAMFRGDTFREAFAKADQGENL